MEKKNRNEIPFSSTTRRAVNGGFTALKIWFWICFAVFLFVCFA